MFRVRKIGFVIFLWLSVGVANNSDTIEPLRLITSEYFSHRFNVETKNVKIKLIHIPEIKFDKYISVIEDNATRLGHQTIWIEDSESHKQYPVTLTVSVKVPVFFPKETIPRNVELIKNMFIVKPQLLKNNYEKYILDASDLNSTISTQVIKKDKPLTYHMLKPKPDIIKGDRVNVELVSGQLTVATKGIAKKDGFKGSRTEVLLDRTGKRVYGEVVGSNIIRIILN